MKKKGNVTFIFVIFLISIIGFFLVFNNFLNSKTIISTGVQESACKALIHGKDTKVGKLYDFLSGINYKCPNDYIESKTKNQNKVFKEVADESVRCYKRYGEGKQDFLSNYDSTGSWCLQCGEINFKNDNSNYKYSDFINYLENNKINEKNSKSKLYSQSFEIKSVKINPNDLLDMKTKINEILQNGNPFEKEIGIILSNQFQDLQNLRSKQIETKNSIYIVYKFDRIDSTNKEALNKAISGAGYGMVGAVGLSIVADTLIWGGISALTCTGAVASGGLLAPLCGAAIIKTGSKIVKSTKSSVSSFTKLKEISDVSRRLKNSIKFTIKNKKFTGINNLDVIGSNTKSLKKLSSFLKSKNNIELSKSIDKIILNMNKLGIKSIDEISPQLLKIQKNKEGLYKIIENSINSNLLKNKGLDKAVKMEGSYVKKIEDFKKLENEVILLRRNLNEINLPKFRSYLKSFFFLSAAAGGAVIASNLNFNSNQYISVMNQEEYFRTCGTQRFSKK